MTHSADQPASPHTPEAHQDTWLEQPEAESPAPDPTPPRRRANDLDGKAWTRYSISIWSDIEKTAEERALKHPAMFPAALAERLITIFTNRSQVVVFDPFAGVGSTIVAAQRLGKHGIGIELNPAFAELARTRCTQPTLFTDQQGTATIHTANALHTATILAAQSVDLVVTSPPYWNILNQKRTADYKAIRTYSDTDTDLGNIADYDEFLQQLQRVFAGVYDVLQRGGYCCVVVMDIRRKHRFYPFHSDVADVMQALGFIYDDLIIWDRRHEYNNMRPLGYPSVFRVNKAHEFILIFQKPHAEDSHGSATD
ncbi:MAG: site-specific DNA-methyltransferase [Chloroflexaceae bacterium]|nr:site-specific DNA-methyltransferase [Chloroflexaceae bacterium]